MIECQIFFILSSFILLKYGSRLTIRCRISIDGSNDFVEFCHSLSISINACCCCNRGQTCISKSFGRCTNAVLIFAKIADRVGIHCKSNQGNNSRKSSNESKCECSIFSHDRGNVRSEILFVFQNCEGVWLCWMCLLLLLSILLLIILLIGSICIFCCSCGIDCYFISSGHEHLKRCDKSTC